MNKQTMRQRLAQVFPAEQAEVLAGVIYDAYNALVKADDFNELKEIMRRLAEAQERTDQRVAELAVAQRQTDQRVAELAVAQRQTDQRVAELAVVQRQTDQRVAELAVAQQQTEQRLAELAVAQQQTEQRLAELAVAQRQTDQRVAELAVAQQQTEQRLAELAVAQRQTDQRVAELAIAQRQTDQRVAELAVAQQQTEQRLAKLTMVVQGLAVELGGLSRAVSYALENEAYRGLPRLLKERLGLEVVGRLMRREVEGEEINIFGEARRGDEVVLVVGEAKLQLDRGRSRASDRARVFTQLRRKVEAVRRAYPGREVVAILVTHYARPVFIEEAKAQGVEVFQSYEW